MFSQCTRQYKMASKKKVIVIGCGYAGSAVASVLDKYPKEIDLTIVTKRDNFLLNKFSALRAAVVNGGWIDRALIPLSHMLKNGHIVVGSVESIDEKGQSVVLASGERLNYDILCIASGSRNFSPAEPPRDATTKEDTANYYRHMHEALANTKHVVVVGSGPVAIEMSGEISTFGQKDVKITMVTRSPHVMHARTPISKSSLESVEDFLRSQNVEIICNDEVASEQYPMDLGSASPLVPTPNGVKLKSGKEIKCDLLVYALGSGPTTSFAPTEWVDPITREIYVDEKTLLVKGTTNVFCVGDAAKINFTKLGYFALEDGKVVGANILALARGKTPNKSISRPFLMIVLPFGPRKGRLLTPWGTFGNWWTSTIKGSGLLTQMMWSQIAPGLKRPPA